MNILKKDEATLIGEMYNYGYDHGCQLEPPPPKATKIYPKYGSTEAPRHARSNKLYNIASIDDFISKAKMSPSLATVVTLAGKLPDNVCLAGGAMLSAITGDKINDLDLFICTSDSQLASNAFVNAHDMLTDDGYIPNVQLDKFMNVQTSKNTPFVQFTKQDYDPVQLIKMVWYDDPSHVIDTFDFTLVQFALTKSSFTFNPLAFMDVIAKRMVLNREIGHIQMLRRALKYASKGYTCDNTQIQKMVDHIKTTEPFGEDYPQKV